MNKIILMIVCFISIFHIGVKAQEGISVEKQGDTGFIWAKDGVNLRESPSTNAPIISKLPYGSAIVVVEQANKISEQVTLFPAAAESPAVVLQGYWLHVQSGDKIGYIFNQFALNIPPITAKEIKTNVGYDASSYIKRAFKLSNPKIIRKKVHEDGATFIKEQRDYAHGQKTHLRVEQSFNDYGWGNATFSHSTMTVEQALIWFSALFNLEATQGINYHPDHDFSASIDEIPNTVEITRVKTGGITIEWNWGAD